MENIFGITEYLRGVIRAEGGDLTERPWLILRRRRAVTILKIRKANRGGARISFQFRVLSTGRTAGTVLSVRREALDSF